MIAMPSTTPWMPGRMCDSCTCRISPSGIRTSAPTTGPATAPMPPNNVTMSARDETSTPNTESGVTMSCTTAYTPPAIAVSVADRMIASSFQTRGLMPVAIMSNPNRVRPIRM